MDYLHLCLSTIQPFNLSAFNVLRFFFLDSDLSTIVAASGADGVVNVELTTVGANGKCGCYCLVMSSALESARLGLSSFRVCHFL